MEIKVLNNLYTDENTYLVIEKGEGIIIDPGTDYNKICELSKDIKIRYIFLTHCHYDHISAVNEIKEKKGAKICCSSKCADHIKNIKISLTQMGLGFPYVIEKTDIIFKDGDKFDFNGITFNILETPGHTSCSVCYMAEDNIFTGDTLFFQNIGRYDLPTGEENSLFCSIKEKIYTLPDKTVIYPGHGKKTGVGYEKKYNFFVRI